MKNSTLIIIMIAVIAITAIILLLLKNKEKKVPESLFPMKKGSTGKAVKLLQISFDAPPNGIWDDTFNRTIIDITDNWNFILTRKLFFDYWFRPALTHPDFPIKPGSQSSFVYALEVMLDAPKLTGVYNYQLRPTIEGYFGTPNITVTDYIKLGMQVFGFTAADFN